MEYSINEIEKAIFYYLTQKGINKIESINTIYNKLCTEKICPDLLILENAKKNKIIFTTCCYTIDQHYNNIHKLFKNNILYLMLSNECVDNIEKIFKNTEKNEDKNENENNFDVDYDNIFTEILNEENNNVNMSCVFGENNNTMLHIICKNEHIELLEKILNSDNESIKETLHLDLNVENSQNKLPTDVLPHTHNGMEMLKMIFNYKHKNIIGKLKQEHKEKIKKIKIASEENLNKQFIDYKCTIFEHSMLVLLLYVTFVFFHIAYDHKNSLIHYWNTSNYHLYSIKDYIFVVFNEQINLWMNKLSNGLID